MAAAKLRRGVLGVAHINNRLLPSFARARHAELVAIASRDPARARAAARAANVPTAPGTNAPPPAPPSWDALYAPPPNPPPAGGTRRAADRGKHVLCEKPLTPTA